METRKIQFLFHLKINAFLIREIRLEKNLLCSIQF